MEIFKTPDHFPDQILTPFPSSASISTSISALDCFFSNEARIPTPDPSSSANPPQKLRPIRCNGKSNADDYGDPEAGLITGEFTGGFYEGGLRAEFGELGILSRQMCGGFGDRMANEDGDGGGSELPHVKGADEVGIGAAFAEEERDSPSDSSTESEVSGASVRHAEGSVSRKKRRTTRKKLAGFMLQLVFEVMQKQEAMHNQLMEMLERKEKENLMREKAWRQQEMERSSREEQMRAEEISRNVAFISFVQNILAQGVQAPEPICIPVKDEVEVHNQRDMDSNGKDETFVTPCDNVQNGVQDMKRPFPEAVSPDLFDQRWLEVELEALVQVHSSLKNNFCNTGVKYSLWDEISAKLQNMGYNRPAWKCKEKWENLNYYHIKRSNTQGNIKSQKYKSFQELDEQHRQGVFRPPCNPSDAAEGHTDHHHYAELS